MVRIAASTPTHPTTNGQKKPKKLKKVKKHLVPDAQPEDFIATVQELINELPENTDLPDVVASLDFCSLKSIVLTPNGRGWIVSFEVPMAEREKVTDLAILHQRVACVHVIKQSRLHR